MDLSSPETLGFAAAILTLVAALFGVLEFARIKSRREQQAEIGAAFAATVRGLSSDDPVEQMVHAILLRRFYDKKSEFALRPRWHPNKRPIYPVDTTRVIGALLKQEQTGRLQKLLAEGLAYAPTLAGSDLQNANLVGAFLGENDVRRGVDISGADLFGADLSGASLRGATARSTKFYEAKAVGTKFNGADLTAADFRASDLRGADFEGATLTSADFTGAKLGNAKFAGAVIDGVKLLEGDIPPLGIPDPEEPTAGGPSDRARPRVFLSVSNRLPTDKAAWVMAVEAELRRSGVEVARILPGDYDHSEPLGRVRREIESCQGVVVLALAEYSTGPDDGQAATAQASPARHFSTVWNQIEAGIAVGMGLPLLVIKDDATGGVLELPRYEGEFELVSLRDWVRSDAGKQKLEAWVKRLQLSEVA